MKRRRIHINTRPQFTPVEHVPVHRKVNYQHVAVRFVDEGNRRITRINGKNLLVNGCTYTLNSFSVEKLLDSEEDQEISNNKIVNKYYTPTVPRQMRFTPIVKYNSRNGNINIYDHLAIFNTYIFCSNSTNSTICHQRCSSCNGLDRD
jgi:hypothetical protein